MPNWVENDLWVYGPEAELRKFREAVKSDWGVLDFDQILPYPEEFWKDDYNHATIEVRHKESLWMDNKVVDGFNNGGYEWRLKNWGCKWNASKPEVYESKSGRYLLYTFDTPWSPPEPVIIEASRKFPRLKFRLRYYERAMGFQGKLVVKAGKIIERWQKEYHGDRGG
jgi:hypothetical protein